MRNFVYMYLYAHLQSTLFVILSLQLRRFSDRPRSPPDRESASGSPVDAPALHDGTLTLQSFLKVSNDGPSEMVHKSPPSGRAWRKLRCHARVVSTQYVEQIETITSYDAVVVTVVAERPTRASSHFEPQCCRCDAIASPWSRILHCYVDVAQPLCGGSHAALRDRCRISGLRSKHAPTSHSPQHASQ